MTTREVRKRAAAAGVTANGRSKTEIIRAIQAAEKNPQCFQTGRQQCPEMSCCWMQDCMTGSRR